MNSNSTSTNGRRLHRYLLLAGLMLLASACATSNVAAPDTTAASTMIKQAEEAGAGEYAPLELQEAREKLERAKARMQDERYAEAARLTREAAVDAELAMVKARSLKAREAVKQLRETIDTLREEIKRYQKEEDSI